MHHIASIYFHGENFDIGKNTLELRFLIWDTEALDFQISCDFMNNIYVKMQIHCDGYNLEREDELRVEIDQGDTTHEQQIPP